MPGSCNSWVMGRKNLCSLALACTTTLFTTGCDEGDGRPELDGEPTSAGGKADGAQQSGTASHAGALRWNQMQPVQTQAGGKPMFVSNNPELVRGLGILAGVPHPGLSLSGGQRASGAPLAQWEICEPGTTRCVPGSSLPVADRVIDPQCPQGGLRDFGVYLAHILPADLGAQRRLSFALHADDDVTVRVRGLMDTSDWSSQGVMLTTQKSWIGARIAETFFFGNPPERTIQIPKGQLVTIDTKQAKSLVEGRFDVETTGGCVYPYTVAHTEAALQALPGNYAPGDVKWPGWFNGQGLGRAAGVHDGDRLSGSQTVRIRTPNGVQGVGVLSQPESLPALAKHGDSADVLFGNYGAMYEQTFEIVNETAQCLHVAVEFVSYIDRNSTPGRTPTARFFQQTQSAGTIPTMFWNGPLQVTTKSGPTLHHAVLNYTPTEAELANPDSAVRSMRHPLTTVPIPVGESQVVHVDLPVPGYIVAPAAFTFSARPC